MEFSADILDIGATILVVDASGDDWAFGDMQVKGREAIQVVESGMPDGNYQVRWRVVSSDGHPISGTFDFAIGNASSAAPVTEGTGSEPAAVPTLEAATDTTTGRNEAVAPPFLLIGIGGAVAGVMVFLAVLVLVKTRRHRGA